MTIDTNRLAIVAGSLANGGVCPLTGTKVFTAETVKHCLSVMYSCGLIDYSGEFAFTIGLPGKSSSTGAIFVVIPNVMGICTLSPRVDRYKISVRGLEFYSRLNSRFNFHLFESLDVKEDPTRQATGGKFNAEELSMEVLRMAAMGDITALTRIRPSEEDLLCTDYDRRTPLHVSASNGHLNVVRYILHRVGDYHINPRDRWNGTPYDDAVREGHEDVESWLLQRGGKSGSECVDDVEDEEALQVLEGSE